MGRLHFVKFLPFLKILGSDYLQGIIWKNFSIIGPIVFQERCNKFWKIFKTDHGEECTCILKTVCWKCSQHKETTMLQKHSWRENCNWSLWKLQEINIFNRSSHIYYLKYIRAETVLGNVNKPSHPSGGAVSGAIFKWLRVLLCARHWMILLLGVFFSNEIKKNFFCLFTLSYLLN